MTPDDILTSLDAEIIIAPQIETVIERSLAQQVEIITSGQQGPPGPPGPVIPDGIAFSYGDVSPILGVTIAAGQRVMECRLIIETPFDGVGAALSIGDAADHQSLLATSQANPAVAGGYYSVPLVQYAATTALNLYLTPGTDPHQGAGKFFIFVEG